MKKNRLRYDHTSLFCFRNIHLLLTNTIKYQFDALHNASQNKIKTLLVLTNFFIIVEAGYISISLCSTGKQFSGQVKKYRQAKKVIH